MVSNLSEVNISGSQASNVEVRCCIIYAANDGRIALLPGEDFTLTGGRFMDLF